MDCKEPNLHISISLVDLVALSLISGQRATELFGRNVKIGFDPIHENEPWIGPIACALFPEYCFVVEHPELIVRKHIFQGFPCIQKPCSISPRRRTALQQLSEMFSKEIFLSSFTLFGISPFVIDLKDIAGEALERIPVSENGKTTFPHHRLKKSFL